jgi:hypothetical protein
LGDESVHPEQQASTENGDAIVKTLAKTCGANCDGTVGQPSDHHCVHDAHAHPANLGKDEWQRKTERQAKVLAP